MNSLINYVSTHNHYDMTEIREILNTMSRGEVIAFLQWNDGNGIYSDAQSIIEGLEPLTESAAKLLAMEQIINS